MPLRFDTLASIRSEGFQGFETVADLLEAGLEAVPKVPGVYLLLWPFRQRPRFRPRSAGGRFRGRDPSADPAMLAARWVETSPVLYVGKAGGRGSTSHLRSRLRLYFRFGAGEPCAHWGGRYVWQLERSQALLVCWRPTPDAEPRVVEKQMLRDFVLCHGRLPFANCVG
jgi:hypothetical protein